MRTRQFFFACAGILLLVVAYTIGASQAKSQSPAHVVAAAPFGQYNAGVIVVLDDGRVYRGLFGEAPGFWEEMNPVPGTSSEMP